MEGVMTYAQAFFGWLLQMTLMASLIIGLILLVQKILGGKLGPRWCHALWLVLLVRMVLPWAPSSRLSLSNLIPSCDQKIQYRQQLESAQHQGPPPFEQTAGTSEAIPDQERESEVALQTPVTPRPPAIAYMEDESGLRLVSIRRVLPILWVAGALIFGAYLLVSNFALWRIIKRDRPLVNQEMLELFEECKAQMGVQSLVVVVPSDQVRSPGLFGFVRPRLLLPREMLDTATREEMRYVFLHELAHLRRHDIYLGWLTSLLQVLHWFNPLVWFAFYRMRTDREFACDALVLARAQKEEPQEYGQAIISLVRRFSRSRPLPAMAGIIESQSQLKRRIAMITQFKNNSYRFSPLAVVLIIAVSFVSLPNAIASKKTAVSWSNFEPGISLRRIKTGPMSDFSSPPSLDGRYLCDLGRRNAEGYPPLAVRDLVTGEVRPLFEASRGFPWCPVISPDSKLVAFVYQSLIPPKSELQLIGMDGTGHRVLCHLKDDEKFHIRAWTPDGRKVLGAFKKGGENLQLVAFSIEDGSMEVIYTFDTYWPIFQSPLYKLAISQDGRYIAYDRPKEKGSWDSDIYVLDIERQRAECIVQNPAYDKLLGWTPDGNYIFFTSDRRQGLPGGFTATDTWDAYLLPVAEGKRQGAPVLIKRDIPDKMRPKGFTRRGTYHYTVEFKSIETAVAKLDLQTGKLLTGPQPVGQTGADQIPAWSPDGRQLAYCTHELDQSQTIRIQDTATGQERKLDPNLPHFSWLRWSPDGKSFLVSNFVKNSPRAIYRINADTGERLTMVQSEASDTLPGEPQLSPDGGTLYYVLYHSDSKKAILITRNIESGHEEELFALDGTRDMRGLTFALSPDGRYLALATQVRGSSGVGADRRISVMPAKGGESRELWKTEERATRPIIAWTPDGQSLLFTKQCPEGGRELWLIPTGDGPARKLCNAQEMMCQGMMYGAVQSVLDMHPDGQRIAFDCFEYRHEVWAMENFLPQEVAPVVKSEPMTTVRRVGYEWRGPFANLSPDGRYMSDRDWNTGTLVVRELATGKSRTLVGRDSRVAGFPLVSAISPDSKEVAYLWLAPNKKDSSLHIVSLEGADHRVLCKGKWLMPREWSSDGQKILALVEENDVWQMVWLSVSNGSLERIAPLGTSYPGKIDLSPDGRFIAYDKPQGEDTLKRDVFVFDLHENRELSVVNHPADDKLLGWTPDGRHMLFVSDRTGTWDAWLQPMADGKPEGFPKLARHGIGNITPIGFTPYGSYYFGYEQTLEDVFIARLDLNSGDVLSEPVPVRQTGATDCHDWSSNGKYLAYCERRPDGSRVIHIRTLATGRERTLSDNLPYIRWLRWSPDNRSLLIDGYKRGDSQGAISKIDVRTGERTDLVRSETEVLIRPEMSPDGRTLFYIRGNDPRSGTVHLMARDLESGHEKELFRTVPPARLMGSTLSPDGQRIVLSIVPGRAGPEGPVLKILSTAGGEPRELIQFDKTEELRGVGVTWMPDSRNVLFWKWFQGDKELELYRVSAEGGEPRRLWSRKALGHMRVHPDGQHVAFYDRSTTRAVWVMENFLPEQMGK